MNTIEVVNKLEVSAEDKRYGKYILIGHDYLICGKDENIVYMRLKDLKRMDKLECRLLSKGEASAVKKSFDGQAIEIKNGSWEEIELNLDDVTGMKAIKEKYAS